MLFLPVTQGSHCDTQMPGRCRSSPGQMLLLPWWMALGWPNGDQGCKETPTGIFTSWIDEKASPESPAYPGSAQLRRHLMGSSSTAGHPGNALPARVCWHETRWSSVVYALSLRDAWRAALGRVKWGRKGSIQEKSGGVLLLLCSSSVRPRF